MGASLCQTKGKVMRKIAALAGLALISACSEADFETGLAEMQTGAAQLTWNNLLAEANREVDANWRDLPFDTGTVYVVANEHVDIHTYSLTPCRGGTHICGGSGGVGHVERTPDYYVVTGAYAGRTFHLSPGGDGYLTWRGVDRDLAWN